jgi:nicotinate-nucleotide pyrophosphorylase (carboxylating)
MEKELQLEFLIKNAIQEDVGDGDHSTLCCIEKSAKGKAVLKVKENGIIAGVEVAEKIFKQLDPSITFLPFLLDGQTISIGDNAFEVHAPIHTILKAERLVLNCMQRMSGIATLTKKYIEKLAGYKTQLLDTRKTTPNFRLLEKMAVKIGGGQNHRYGLYDMIMLKDNHIDYCGSIEKAINLAYEYVQTVKPGMKIEVETRSIEDVMKVVSTGKIDRIMLDNFNVSDIITALSIIDGKFETEASGGINFDNLEDYAATGVDFISSGAIIHHATGIDLSLKAITV